MSEQDTTNEDIILLTLTIRHLKQEIKMIEQKTVYDDLLPFITDQSLPIESAKINDFDLSTFSFPFQIIIFTNPLGSALARNNRRLLMDQRLNLHVFDQDLTTIKRYQWKYGFIRNMCWSSILNHFIAITNRKQVFLINENVISIECIQTIQEQNWCSCTCSDDTLFLTINTQGTNIFQFNLSLIFELVQH